MARNSLTVNSSSKELADIDPTIPVSQVIKNRIKKAKKSFFANDNISDFIKEGELEELQAEVQEKIEAMLQSLVIDTEHDHNTKDTAKRVAKMYIKEVFSGRYRPAPPATDFPNFKKFDELYIVGPISIRSACSHHLVPIIGYAWIGVLPSKRLKGLSKFNRLVQWIMERPHIQEEAAVMIADYLEKELQPQGIAVVVKAHHMCVAWRGVKDKETLMMNSIMRGAMKTKPMLRAEFLDLIKGMKYTDPAL